jgi:hypothetical protein
MKRIAFILALILALTPLLVACSSGTKTGGVNLDNIQIDDNSKKEDEVIETYSLDDLPELDFGGKEFGIYIDKGAAEYLISEEETGDLVGDAVFQRNLAIEDKFNLKFNMVEAIVNQPCVEIRNFILADDKTYHMFVNVQHNIMPQLILDGYFVDWNELEYLDYTKPYWNTKVATDINFGSKVYTMGGDLNLRTYNNTNCIRFNKNLFDDLGIAYPYEDVYNYTWTIDKFIEITKQGYSDLNGSTAWEADADRLGFTGWGWEMVPAVYVGLGAKPVVADDNNLPVLNFNNERTVKVVDKLIELFDGVNAYNNTDKIAIIAPAYAEGRCLMQDTWVTGLNINRDSEFESGLLPYPMLDTDQGEYYSRAANIAHLCYIPTTNVQLEETGIILEGMSIESYNTIRPVYYDVTLSLKEIKDEESKDMVDIILESSTYFVEGFFSSALWQPCIKSQTNTFASWYAANEFVFVDKIEDMREFYAR